MSHYEQVLFCEEVKKRFPSFFGGTRVLDIGSLDINGSNRYLFEGCSYIGLDIGKGPNVDVVCIAHEFEEPDGSFDVVLSTNCFEHDRYFPKTIANMVRLVRSGGLMFFTCKTTGGGEHGTVATDSFSSPFTSQIDGWKDYYGNVDEVMVREAVDVDACFTEYQFDVNDVFDITFWGLRR